MIRLNWSNPKITLIQLESFLSPYLGSNYNGLNQPGDGYVYIETLEPMTGDQETYILNYVYSLNDVPQLVMPVAPKNEYCMEPWGSVKKTLIPSEQTSEITLSNQSEDGCTFDYICSKPLAIGNYIFQQDNCNRSWVMSFTETSLTVELPVLFNGIGLYSVGVYSDELVRDWKPLMYLWGLFFNAKNYSNDDFVELSIVDMNDLFLNDDFCMAVFGASATDSIPYIEAQGFEQNGEYGHWTKYYDEQWVLNCSGREIKTPDGSPGCLLPNLYLRMSYFSTGSTETKTHFYVDYSPTSKD